MIKTKYVISRSTDGPHVSSASGDSFKIALVTDIHEYEPSRVLDILCQEHPDVIALAGDTLERHGKGENLDVGDPSLFSRLICAGSHLAEKLSSIGNHTRKDTCLEYGHQFLREAGTIAPVVMSLGNHELFLTREDDRVMKEAGALTLPL